MIDDRHAYLVVQSEPGVAQIDLSSSRTTSRAAASREQPQGMWGTLLHHLPWLQAQQHAPAPPQPPQPLRILHYNGSSYYHYTEQSKSWPRLLNMMAEDLLAGFVDGMAMHIVKQSSYLDTFPTRVDRIIHLENVTTEWRQFLLGAALKPEPWSMPPTEGLMRHKHSQDMHLASAAEALSATNLAALCRYYAGDYDRLGYPLPQACEL